MELQLIKSEQFGTVQADFYNHEKNICMTANQLSQCLGYKHKDGMKKVISRHPYIKEKEFSCVVKVDTWEGGQNVPTPKQHFQETRLFNEDGIYEVAFLSNTDKAKEFRAWIRKVLKSLRSGQAQIVKPMTPIEMLRLQNEVISDIDMRMDSLENKLENQITLDYGQQRTLQNEVSKRAYHRVGQAYPFDIKENVGGFFRAIYKDLKNRFGVASYRDINTQNYTDAINYIKGWIEPVELRG